MTAEVLTFARQCPTPRQVKEQLIYSLPNLIGPQKARAAIGVLQTDKGVDANLRLVDGIDDDDISLIIGFIEESWLDGTAIDCSNFPQDHAGAIISATSLASFIEKCSQ